MSDSESDKSEQSPVGEPIPEPAPVVVAKKHHKSPAPEKKEEPLTPVGKIALLFTRTSQLLLLALDVDAELAHGYACSLVQLAKIIQLYYKHEDDEIMEINDMTGSFLKEQVKAIASDAARYKSLSSMQEKDAKKFLSLISKNLKALQSVVAGQVGPSKEYAREVKAERKEAKRA